MGRPQNKPSSSSSNGGSGGGNPSITKVSAQLYCTGLLVLVVVGSPGQNF
jgi:hypothetical protein